jgi:hypothetical protein
VSIREHDRRVTPVASDEATRALKRACRRQRAGVFNRRLGWFILPLVIVASAIHWGPGGYHGTRNLVVIGIQLVYAPLAVVHAGLSVYVFGWVPWRRTLRVFHIWFGYFYVLFMLASQTSFGLTSVHRFLTIAMFASLAVHVAIGARMAWRRRLASAERVDLTG